LLARTVFLLVNLVVSELHNVSLHYIIQCNTAQSPLVYSPTAYHSLHPIRLCQTILLLHLTNCVELPTSQYPVQSIARCLQVKTKDICSTLFFYENLSHVM